MCGVKYEPCQFEIHKFFPGNLCIKNIKSEIMEDPN